MRSKTCLNCGAAVVGSYCPDCGQDAAVARLNLRRSLAHAAGHFLTVDSRVRRTVLELTRDPGRVCREYADGRRVSYVQPFRYCLSTLAFLMLVYAVIGRDNADFFFKSEAGLSPAMREFQTETLGFVLRHLNLVFLLAIPMTALILKGLYRQSRFNYAEIMSFTLYVMGHNFLLGTVTAAVLQPFPQVQAGLRYALQVVYLVWASRGFFGGNLAMVGVKSLLVVVLNLVTIVIIISTYVAPRYVEATRTEQTRTEAPGVRSANVP